MLRHLILALALMAAPASAETLRAADTPKYQIDEPMPRPAAARLVWSDEFDTLDLSRWSFDTHRNKAGWYNEEKQYYSASRPENARIEDGVLIIEARKDAEAIRQNPDWGGQQYSAARLTTLGKAGWTYGYFEIRARLPCARGTWPAIWMLPDSGRWPDGGEIDIMEHIGVDPRIIHANLHTGLYNHNRGTQRGASTKLASACDQFHRYQLHWTADSITIGIDDRAYFRVLNNQPGGRGAWPFDAPFHMILNHAIGGSWAGTKGIDDKALPQRFEVDYVRVWQ